MSFASPSRLNGNRPVTRISMSLPEELLSDLDSMVEARGFESRSQAINDVLAYVHTLDGHTL